MAKGRRMPMGMPGGGNMNNMMKTGSKNAKANGRYAKRT